MQEFSKQLEVRVQLQEQLPITGVEQLHEQLPKDLKSSQA
jgi:hypothetical protein